MLEGCKAGCWKSGVSLSHIRNFEYFCISFIFEIFSFFLDLVYFGILGIGWLVCWRAGMLGNGSLVSNYHKL